MKVNPINKNQTNFGAVYKVQATQSSIKHFDANIAQTAKNKGKSVVAFVQKAAFKYKPVPPTKIGSLPSLDIKSIFSLTSS